MEESPPPSPPAAASRPVSILSAAQKNEVSILNHLADVVVRVCNTQSLDKKRDLVNGFIRESEDVDAFTDEILRVLGARNEHSQHILNMD